MERGTGTGGRLDFGGDRDFFVDPGSFSTIFTGRQHIAYKLVYITPLVYYADVLAMAELSLCIVCLFVTRWYAVENTQAIPRQNLH